jgi:hypothetical protein
VRGDDGDSCGSIEANLAMAVTTRPPPLVLGSSLNLRAECPVTVAELNSDFQCGAEEEEGMEEGMDNSLFIIIGGAVGGFLLFALLILSCMCAIAIVCRKRRNTRKSRTL